MSNTPFNTQIEKNIQLLLNEQKYQEAHELCKSAIKAYPEEQELLKLKKIIEKVVEEKNREIFKKQLKEAKSLIAKENYIEGLRQFYNLLKQHPEDDKLKEIYKNAQYKYQRHTDKQQEKFVEKEDQKLNTIFKKNPEQILNAIYNLEQNNPGIPRVQELGKKYRRKYIEREIKNRKELLSGRNIKDIRNFLELLKKIDISAPQVKELEDQFKEKEIKENIRATREYKYKGDSYFDTLIKLEKYDKAMKVAEEILEAYPGDTVAQRELEKATALFNKQSKRAVINKIREAFPALKSEYQGNKTAFIKL